MSDVMPIKNYHQTGTNCFHVISICDKDAGIFSETYSNTSGIGGNSLHQPSESPTCHEMRVNDYIRNKCKSGGDFYFPFHQCFLAASVINHSVRHCHCTGTCACYHEIFVLVSVMQYIKYFGASKDRTQPKLITSCKHHAITGFNPFDVIKI